MDVSVSITTRSGDEVAENLEASVSEDNYSPDLADDALRCCTDTVLRLHRELHPAPSES